MDVPPPVEKLIPFAVPSDRAWFDPPLILAATRMDVQTWVLPLNTVVQVAVPDPMRVAIGFAGISGVLLTFDIAPWADVDKFSIGRGPPGQPVWFTTREHLSLPTCGWWVFQSAGTVARVITITREARGT